MTPRIVGGELTARSYADVSSVLTALGSSYEGQVRLVGSTGLTIGRWAYVGSTITPIGPVDFSRVTATPNGAAASVAGAVVTVSAGHSLATQAKVLRVWNTTDGTLIADEASGTWSVSGNDVTMSAATAGLVNTALGASKVVRLWVEGVSELCIGGSTCAVWLQAAATAAFTGARLDTLGEVLYPCAPRGLTQWMRANLATYTAPSSAAQIVAVGMRKAGGSIAAFGFGHNGAEIRPASRVDATYTYGGGAVIGTQIYVSMASYRHYLDVPATYVGGPSSSLFFVAASLAPTLTDAYVCTVATLPASFTSLTCA